MSEGPCDGFEVAIEMRLHGELEADAAQRLDAHLAQCPSCRDFEARARRLEFTLREAAHEAEASVDWKALRSRIGGWRTQSLLATIAVGTIVLTATVKSWLDRIALTSGPAPDLHTLPLEVLFNAVAVGFLVWHVWTRWRDVRQATSPRYLTYLYRKDLAGRIRSARLMFWGSSPICLLAIFGFFGPAFGSEALASRLFYAALLGGIVWERFVVLPRLEREEQDLPYFDDVPHLF